MFKGISFQVFRAEYENPFLAYSRLYLGIWIFLQNLEQQFSLARYL